MVEDNQADSIETSIKNLSNEVDWVYSPRLIERLNFEDACNFYQLVVRKTNQIIPLLYEKGRAEGKSVKEIRDKIVRLDIPYRTMLRYTPDWAKRSQKSYERKRVAKWQLDSGNQAKLADVVPVSIPPPEQTIIEPQPEKELVPGHLE